jgi:3'-phosphoadenosine 5'-phosphosulfate sulfotransferase (PAPS reductase)/FAD synthetase
MLYEHPPDAHGHVYHSVCDTGMTRKVTFDPQNLWSPCSVPSYESVALDFVRDMLVSAAQDHHEVVVAFGGGKESLVLLDLVARAARFLKLKEWPHVLYVTRARSSNEEMWRELRDLDCFVDMTLDKEEYASFVQYTVCAPSFETGLAIFLESARIVRTVFVGTRDMDEDACLFRDLRVRRVPQHGEKEPLILRAAPLLVWTHGEVWDYVDKYGLRYPGAYERGYSRVGSFLVLPPVRDSMLKRVDGTYAHARQQIEMLARHFARLNRSGHGSDDDVAGH